jgi:hypothetical protein
MPLALSQPTLAEGSSPPFEAGRKLGAVAIALVWQLLHEQQFPLMTGESYATLVVDNSLRVPTIGFCLLK